MTEILIINEAYPDRQKWIDFMNKEMKVRSFPDKIKGCVDIDHKEIEEYFTALLKRNGLDIKIKRAWIHFMAPKANHSAGHDHDVNVAVVYLQIPKDSGNLKLIDINRTIIPEENMLVVIPRLAKHSMSTNNSDGMRLAMGFTFDTSN